MREFEGVSLVIFPGRNYRLAHENAAPNAATTGDTLSGVACAFAVYSIIRTEAQGIRKRNVSDLPETRCYGTLRHAMLGEHRNLNA